ncbi:MAG: VWA domain-containing protein, partial [Planctomycetes bacterium]|nr:VWA domain-containing protein [Planctomycetota bacterium]
MTRVFGTIQAAEPLGLGIAIVCLTLMLVTLLRHGRSGLQLGGILFAGSILGLIAADIRVGEHEPENLILVDTSASVEPLMRRQWWQELRDEIGRLAATSNAPARVIFFDGEAHGARAFSRVDDLPEDLPLSRSPALTIPQSVLALLGEDRPIGNVVMVSDWHFPERDWLDLKSGLRAKAYHALEIPERLKDAARLDALIVPERVAPGESFIAKALVSSTEGGMLTLAVEVEGGEAVSSEVPIAPDTGSDPLTLLTAPMTEGLVTVRAKISGKHADDLPGNNELVAVLEVGAQRPLLYVRGQGVRPNDDPLHALLAAGDIPVELAPSPQALLADAKLSEYAAIVLNDLPLSAISDGGRALATAVARDGVPLFVVGAAHAFGPGGYNGSPLERVLPLDANPRPDRMRRHVLLLDASSSMGEALGNQTRFGWLREAAMFYLSRCDREDQAMIAPFSSTLLPMGAGFTPVDSTSRTKMMIELASVIPNGETAIFGPLSRAMELVSGGGADVAERRIVLITDGQNTADGDAEFSKLASGFAEIQLDVLLLVGEEPRWVKQLAAGGGKVRVRSVENFFELGDVLRKNLDDDQRALLHSESSPTAFDAALMPLEAKGEAVEEVRNWVETALKANARAPLRVDDERKYPLLAWIERGGVHGRSASLALSCADGSSSLAADAELQRLTAQMIRWLTARETSGRTLRLSAQRDGRGALLTLSSFPIEEDDAGDVRVMLLGGDERELT